jgi:hypothetical protein
VGKSSIAIPVVLAIVLHALPALALPPERSVELPTMGRLRFTPHETDPNVLTLTPPRDGAKPHVFVPEPDDAVLEEAWVWDGRIVTRWSQGTRVEAIRVFDRDLKPLKEWVSEGAADARVEGDALVVDFLGYDEETELPVPERERWSGPAAK